MQYIRPIADQIFGKLKRANSLSCSHLKRSGTEAYDKELSAHRRSQRPRQLGRKPQTEIRCGACHSEFQSASLESMLLTQSSADTQAFASVDAPEFAAPSVTDTISGVACERGSTRPGLLPNAAITLIALTGWGQLKDKDLAIDAGLASRWQTSPAESCRSICGTSAQDRKFGETITLVLCKFVLWSNDASRCIADLAVK